MVDNSYVTTGRHGRYRASPDQTMMVRMAFASFNPTKDITTPAGAGGNGTGRHGVFTGGSLTFATRMLVCGPRVIAVAICICTRPVRTISATAFGFGSSMRVSNRLGANLV